MRSAGTRVFIGVLLGIAVGMFAADPLPVLLRWAGILAGGCVGAFIAALPEIVRHTPKAARLTWETLDYLPQHWKRYQTASPQERRKYQAVLVSIPTFAMVVAIGLLPILTSRTITGHTLAGDVLRLREIMLVHLLIIMGYWMVPVTALTNIFCAKGTPENPQWSLLYVSPIGPPLYMWLVFIRVSRKAYSWLSSFVQVTRRVVGEIGSFIAMFTGEVCRQVNSRPVLFTFLASIVGAAIFFHLFRVLLGWRIEHGAIVGALIGAFASWLYYKLVIEKTAENSVCVRP